MPSKIRKQIYIESHQEQMLKAIAQQTGISEAEIIRSCINLHISSITTPQTNIAAWEAELVFINGVKNRDGAGEAGGGQDFSSSYQNYLDKPLGGRDWQREDLYER